MKAITIWQPWASLLACGAKQFETRSWATSYRGPIAIHAAKNCFKPFACNLPAGFTKAAAKVLWPGVTDLCAIADNWDELPHGAVIAVGDLIDCHEIVCDGLGIIHLDRQMNSLNVITNYGKVITGAEILFGDWTPGRFAWEISNVKMLEQPVPTRGKQRLWNWEGAA